MKLQLMYIYLCLISTILSANVTVIKHGNFTIYMPQPHFITNYYIPLEQTVYEQLNKDPLHTKVNYLAVGWKHAIDNKKLGQVKNALKDLKLDGGFTVCQHINPEVIVPILKDVGIDTLFTPHVKASKKYDLNWLPLPHYAMNGHQYTELPKKDILYSFIGFWSCRFRRELFKIQHPDNTIIKRRRLWHFSSRRRRQQNAKEYTNVLLRSRFSLCPRGSGPSTLRFWESLASGAIPVSIADDLVLPSGVKWDDCIVRIAEKNVRNIPHIVAQISPEQERIMRQNCIDAYKLFSGEQFSRVIREYYEKNS